MQRRLLLSAACASLFCGSAYAVTVQNPTRSEVPANFHINQPELPGFLSDTPVSVTANAGFADYTGALGSHTKLGPTIGISVDATKKKLYGVELGAEVSQNALKNGFIKDGRDFTTIPDKQSVWRWNLGALLKVGPELRTGIGPIRPYAGGGIGFSYINVTDGAVPPYRNDFLTEFPLVLGADYHIGKHITVGVRGTWRFFIFGEWAEPTASANNPNGGMLGALVNLGGRF